MVHYQRYQLWKKGIHPHITEDTESQVFIMDFSNSGYYKRTRPKFLHFFFLFLLSCSFILVPYLFSSSSSFSLLNSFNLEKDGIASDMDVNAPLCSSITNGTICCDRSSIRSDVCFMKGDIRTSSVSSSIFLYTSKYMNGLMNYNSSISNEEDEEEEEFQHEKVKPYTRKWEKSVMDTINELDLVGKEEKSSVHHRCDIRHDVPAVFFSTGGYTGNVYHEFNDGILPLYITSQHLKKKVVFVILEYHNWWMTKYADILSHLSDYPPIDFSADKRTHCFPEAIVGLKIHDELSIDSSLMKGNKSIVDFRKLLDKAYRPRVQSLTCEEKLENNSPSSEVSLHTKVEDDNSMKPKLVILSRNGSRVIMNEKLIVKIAEEIGFVVEVLRPDRTTELAKIYRSLNSSDVMVGVHGAAMTHFLFMRPASVFIQVIPLGTVWAAETYYGEPARRLGLKYIGYEILPRESSLYDKYDRDDAVLRDPSSVTKRGWEYTKKIYLDDQNVRLNVRRFQKRLFRAYYYCIAKMRRHEM